MACGYISLAPTYRTGGAALCAHRPALCDFAGMRGPPRRPALVYADGNGYNTPPRARRLKPIGIPATSATRKHCHQRSCAPLEVVGGRSNLRDCCPTGRVNVAIAVRPAILRHVLARVQNQCSPLSVRITVRFIIAFGRRMDIRACPFAADVAFDLATTRTADAAGFVRLFSTPCERHQGAAFHRRCTPRSRLFWQPLRFF